MPLTIMRFLPMSNDLALDGHLHGHDNVDRREH